MTDLVSNLIRSGLTSVYVPYELRAFARKFSNVEFFLQILPLKDDELVMSQMLKKMGGHRLRFGENLPGRTP